jgi:hypothetical protein
LGNTYRRHPRIVLHRRGVKQRPVVPGFGPPAARIGGGTERG